MNGGINTYGYVGGNPVNAIDIWGLSAVITTTPQTLPHYYPEPKPRVYPRWLSGATRIPVFGWGLGAGMYAGDSLYDTIFPKPKFSLDDIEPLPKPEYTIDDIIQMSESSTEDGNTCPVPGEENKGKKKFPSKGEPNEWIEGERRGRQFDDDGNPAYDIDKPHQGYPEWHVHEWQNGVREHPGRPVSPVDGDKK